MSEDLQRCAPDVWDAWLKLRALVTGEGGGEPVRYGPGRGLWVPGQGWTITRGPGGLDRDGWKSKAGATYPSFHCSSWTNFFLGWLTCRGSLYTHSGNIPPLDQICTTPGDKLTAQKGAAAWRGYGERCVRMPGRGKAATVTWADVAEGRDAFPTFSVFAQSTMLASGRWKWWHHTGVIVRDPSTGAIERVAADGFKGRGGVYSATPMDAEVVDDAFARKNQGRVILYVFHVRPNLDGAFSADGAAPSPAQMEAR
jgi:hypothetical protein